MRDIQYIRRTVTFALSFDSFTYSCPPQTSINLYCYDTLNVLLLMGNKEVLAYESHFETTRELSTMSGNNLTNKRVFIHPMFIHSLLRSRSEI